MASRKSEFPTMQELLAKVQVGKSRGRYATTGLTPKAFPRREGAIVLQPEEILSVRIAQQHIADGSIRGYQRKLIPHKAREIARWMVENNGDYMAELPAVEISLDDGQAFADDGQHRLAGAVIARRPIRVLVTKRTRRQAKALFAGQVKATRVNRNVLIFDGDGVIDEYIQDAVTNPQHPWNGLISTSQSSVGSGTNRISATSAYIVLTVYAAGYTMRGTHSPSEKNVSDRFDREAADELVDLIKAFGDKSANPFAFSATGLRAISNAARIVFRDNEPGPNDKDRWMRHMPKFPFASYQYIRSSVEMGEQLVRFWNKGLSADRKIAL